MYDSRCAIIIMVWLMKLEKLKNPKNVHFNDLVNLCKKNFGKPRINGSHFKFKTPFKDDPIINLQPDKKNKKMAKPYQVDQVRKILQRMEDEGYGIRS